jgi:Flp pilus assembly protein TadG
MNRVPARKMSASPGRILRRLHASISGVAMIEFAFAAPLVLGMGMLGIDTASLVLAHMQVSQIAMQTADNASRVGVSNELSIQQINEADINESLVGAERVGEGIGIYTRGRVIISSLQRNEDDGQWIAWQRCRGAKNHPSSYGEEDDGETGTTFAGMGAVGNEITAAEGTAVIFVEVAYDFESVSPLDLFDGDEIVYTAAFNVRDNRDLTGGANNNGLFQTNPAAPVARCNVFSANPPS